MRRWLWIELLGILCCSCTALSPLTPVSVPPTAESVPATRLSSPTPSPQTPTPTSTPLPGPGLEPAAVRFFPQPLTAGDTASIDVLARLPDDIPGPFTLTVTLPNATPLTTTVAPQGLDGVPRARFYWEWATAGLTGTQWLTFTLIVPPEVSDPDLADNSLGLAVMLHPPETLLPPEPLTRWAVTETTGIHLHYLTHTAAERDLPQLIAEAQAAYRAIAAQLGESTQPTHVYLLDRVIGQGGYASEDWIAVTYTDRNYAPANLPMLLRHELVHRLDASIGCQSAPALLREGLAVYLPGGHYRPEPVPQEAALLLATDRFIPLSELATGFYTHQHEIGYLEAGALIAYVVDQYGWEPVRTLCQATTQTTGGQREQLEAGVQALGAADLADFEQAWLTWLRAVQTTPQERTVLDLELRLMDTMRIYQVRYDPAAHFLSGILFDPQVGAGREIIADFVRRPREPEALALEMLLQQAGALLVQNDTTTATAVLDAVEEALVHGFPETGLTADFRAISQAALAAGYEPYRLACDQPARRCQVAALARDRWPTPHLLTATWDNGRWSVQP